MSARIVYNGREGLNMPEDRSSDKRDSWRYELCDFMLDLFGEVLFRLLGGILRFVLRIFEAG